MGPARGSQGRREYGFPPDRPSAVFCLGRMGHWNGDRDCEPTRLTVVVRMGETGEKTPPRPERRNPAMGRPWRGLLLDHTNQLSPPAMDIGLRSARRPHADLRLRANVRGCHGSVRQELAEGNSPALPPRRVVPERKAPPKRSKGGAGGWGNVRARCQFGTAEIVPA